MLPEQLRELGCQHWHVTPKPPLSVLRPAPSECWWIEDEAIVHGAPLDLSVDERHHVIDEPTNFRLRRGSQGHVVPRRDRF